MKARISAHENGQWVRDAAMTYSVKQEIKKINKAV